MTPPPHIVQREVVDLRVVPGLLGWPTVQLRRRLVRIRLVSPVVVTEEPAGCTPWHRMRRQDYADTAVFLDKDRG